MGWFYGPECNRKRYIESLNRDHTGDRWRILKQCFKGNPGNGSLWSVYERTDGSGDRLLGHDLLKFRPGAAGGWGHKPMDESCGPYETNCPLAYLSLVPDPGGFATAFRARVRERHERARRPVHPGEVWTRPGFVHAVVRIDGLLTTGGGLVVEAVVGSGCHLVRRSSLGEPVRRDHLTPTVIALLAARADPAVVADALEDAGCEAEEVLARLRTRPTPDLTRLLAALENFAALSPAPPAPPVSPRRRKPELEPVACNP